MHEDINYYIEPKEAVERLGNLLCEGKFCLLYGHQQSGKTTTAYAIEEWLITNHDKEVYIMTIFRIRKNFIRNRLLEIKIIK